MNWLKEELNKLAIENGESYEDFIEIASGDKVRRIKKELAKMKLRDVNETLSYRVLGPRGNLLGVYRDRKWAEDVFCRFASWPGYPVKLVRLNLIGQGETLAQSLCWNWMERNCK